MRIHSERFGATSRVQKTFVNELKIDTSRFRFFFSRFVRETTQGRWTNAFALIYFLSSGHLALSHRGRRLGPRHDDIQRFSEPIIANLMLHILHAIRSEARDKDLFYIPLFPACHHLEILEFLINNLISKCQKRKA